MKTQAELIEATTNVLMPNYGQAMLAMARGEGARIWDADGKEYIDFFAGFGAGGVTGHCHPLVVEAVTSQARTLLSHGNFFTNEPQVRLAEAITRNAFGGKVFFCHSGPRPTKRRSSWCVWRRAKVATRLSASTTVSMAGPWAGFR